MALPGLVAANNLADTENKEAAWDNLGDGIDAVILATNSIRNNTMVGATAGSPGTFPTNWEFTNSIGLSYSVVGTGVDDGISYIDIRFFGTVAASGVGRELYFAFDSLAAIPVAQGQQWMNSCYVKIVAGSLTGIVSGELYLVANNGLTSNSTGEAPFYGFDYSSLTGPFSECRVSQAYTFVQANTLYVEPRIDVNFTNDANNIDFTLRIGMPQLERGKYLTPPIATTNAAASALATVSFSIKGREILALREVNKASTRDFVFIKGLRPAVQPRITIASQYTASGVALRDAAMLKIAPTTRGNYFFSSGLTLSGVSCQINGTNARSIATSPFSGSGATVPLLLAGLRPQANWRISEAMASGTVTAPETAIPIETSDFVLFIKAGQN